MLIFHGMLRSANFGDVLMAQISLEWLREMTDVQIKAMFVAPELRKQLDLPAASVFDLMCAQAAVLSGGGYFQIADGGLPAIKRFIKNAGPLLLAQLARRPTAIFGVGVGPVPSGILETGVRRLFAKSQMTCVRDRTSIETVQRLVPQAPVIQTADLVFTLEPEQIPAPARLFADELVKLHNGQRHVGILFSNTPDYNAQYEAVFAAIIKNAKQNPDTHYVLLEDHVDVNSGQRRCQSQLRDQLGDERTTVLPYPGTFELTALLGRMDAVLTDKLHVGLVAAAMGVQPFSIAKHPKNMAAYAAIGLQQNCLLIGSATAAQCDELVSRAFNATGKFAVSLEVVQASGANREHLRDFLEKHQLLKPSKMPN